MIFRHSTSGGNCLKVPENSANSPPSANTYRYLAEWRKVYSGHEWRSGGVAEDEWRRSNKYDLW
jgi:hypothetical protein